MWASDTQPKCTSPDSRQIVSNVYLDGPDEKRLITLVNTVPCTGAVLPACLMTDPAALVLRRRSLGRLTRRGDVGAVP